MVTKPRTTAAAACLLCRRKRNPGEIKTIENKPDFEFKMSDDRFDNRRYYNEDTFSIQSTAGAIPVKNKKGEISMEKVKVHRYVSGKRPEYARPGRQQGGQSSSESESSDEEDFTAHRSSKIETIEEVDEEYETEIKDEDEEMPEEDLDDINDPRLRRLKAARQDQNASQRHPEDEAEDRVSRHRRIHEPEVLSEGEEDLSLIHI